jgi:inhibitor of KinA
MQYAWPRFCDQGETALSVEFGDAVDPAIHARVLALDAALQTDPPAGLRETTPTYRALLLRYEPLEIDRAALVEAIVARVASNAPPPLRAQRRWTLPCCYDPVYAEDIAEAAQALGLTVEALARRHAGAEYRVYMYGFAPGWCYLGGLPDSLAMPRRLTPRGVTPPGAILIGGGLSLVAANPMPTGWYVVGRTPEKLFSLRRQPHFLVEPGDAIRFAPVDAAAFAALETRAAQGETLARCEQL